MQDYEGNYLGSDLSSDRKPKVNISKKRKLKIIQEDTSEDESDKDVEEKDVDKSLEKDVVESRTDSDQESEEDDSDEDDSDEDEEAEEQEEREIKRKRKPPGRRKSTSKAISEIEKSLKGKKKKIKIKNPEKVKSREQIGSTGDLYVPCQQKDYVRAKIKKVDRGIFIYETSEISLRPDTDQWVLPDYGTYTTTEAKSHPKAKKKSIKFGKSKLDKIRDVLSDVPKFLDASSKQAGSIGYTSEQVFEINSAITGSTKYTKAANIEAVNDFINVRTHEYF